MILSCIRMVGSDQKLYGNMEVITFSDSLQPVEPDITVGHETNRITTDGPRSSESIDDSILMIIESPVVKKKGAGSSNGMYYK